MSEEIKQSEPVSTSMRNTSIDTLRGVAVLGILVMNIYGFSMSFAAYENPLASGGTEWYNMGVWFFTHLFFDQKFMAIFSILFGAGLVMMATRAEVSGLKYRGNWFRRNFWLLIIGAIHGYFLWFGDVLFHYALIGMLIYPMRNRSPRVLIITATILLTLGILMSFMGGTYMNQLSADGLEIQTIKDTGEELTNEQAATLREWDEASMFMKPPAEQVREDTQGYMGEYSTVVEHRAPMVLMMQTQGTFGFVIWRVGGLMLLGMALMKLGIISGKRTDAFYKKMMIIGYGLGLPLVFFSAWNLHAHQWDFLWVFRVGNIPNYIGSILMAFGHIALVMTLCKSGSFKNMLTRFSAVGRMAFTNYLLHSVILTTVFYGYGFGLYGQVPRIGQMGIVAIVLGFQLWMSPLWLRYFRFGPAEWIWRSLTYWRLQPMRRNINTVTN